MWNWKVTLGVLSGVVAVFVIAGFGATSGGTKPYDANLMASWMQAIGSIAAIIGAVWVANEQYRRDAARREEEQDKASYLLGAELAWVSGDVVAFLNEFINIKAGFAPPLVVSNDDIADLLERLSWCRQRAERKGQLGMVGALRDSLTRTLRILRKRDRIPDMAYTPDEVAKLKELRSEAVTVFNVACGVETHKQFSS